MGKARAFFGRSEDLEALDRLAGEGERLITLTGAGGVGKTRLARRWAELAWEGRGGWHFADLADARTPEEVCGAVARAVGVGPGRSDTTASLATRVGRSIAARGRTLLVLDNCEQAIDAVAEAVDVWLACAPEALFLLTSREALRVGAERVHPVPPLAVPEPGADPTQADAVRMFADRVERALPGWTLEARDVPLVAEIVKRLDGLPLAIELAAARAAVLGVPAILERLAHRLELLGGGARDMAERQRTMRAAIQWSWDLLAPWEKAALAQCSVFRGGFTAEAAEAVVDLGRFASIPPAADDATVSATRPTCLDVLHSLTDKSMLRSYEPRGAPGTVRLGMFAAVRDYCGERLEAVGEADRARARHAAHYVSACSRIVAEIPTRHGPQRMRALALEIENLAAAHERAIAAPGSESAREAARAMLAMEPVLASKGSTDELLRLLDATVDRCEAAGLDDRSFARVLVARAEALAGAGQLASARADLDRTRAMPGGADPTVVAHALGTLGLLQWHAGDLAAAESTLARAADAAHEAGSDVHEAVALRRLANLMLDLRRLDDAARWTEGAHAIVLRTGDRREEGPVLATRSLVLHLLGRPEQANEAGVQALRAFREMGDAYREAVTLGNLGMIQQLLAHAEEARAYFEQCIAAARHAGDRRLFGHAAAWLARLDHEQGRLEAARDRYVEALEVLRDIPGAGRARTIFTAARAALEADLGATHLAARLVEDAGRLAPSDDDPVAGALRVYHAYVALVGSGGAALAREEVTRSSPLAAQSEDVAFALRLVEARLASPDARHRPIASDALHVGRRGEWFRPPGSAVVDLAKRRSLRLVLVALAEQRQSAPGDPITVEALVKRGWPGERMRTKSGATRAYTSITRLRKLGLSDLLISRTTGYLLDPRVALVLDEK